MKDKLKNTLEHEVELLGRSISVLAIAGLLVAGGASAALLNTFGTVPGDTTVDQAVTLNSNNVETQSASWSLSDVDAGESVSGDAQTLNNNLDESATVDLDGDVSTPTVDTSLDDSATSGTQAYSGQYVLLENGVSFTNTEPNNDGDESGGQDSASTSYVYTGSKTAVETTYTSETGHVHSGLWFNVSPTAATDAVIEPDLVGDDSNNDWIYAVVEYGDQLYLTGKFDGATEYDLDSNTQFTYEVQDSDGEQMTDISSIEKREDFEKGSERDALSQAVDDGSIPWSEVTVHYAVAGTGTQDGDGDGGIASGSLTYTDFKFNDGDEKESLMTRINPGETVSGFEAPSGNHELGFAADFKVNAYPGDYDFDLEVIPESVSQ